MEYLVVAFRSRAQTIKFSEYLRLNGIYGEIVNTPKEAGVGCGLSVKTSKANYAIMKKAVYYSKLDTFAGVFLVSVYGGKRIVRSV